MSEDCPADKYVFALILKIFHDFKQKSGPIPDPTTESETGPFHVFNIMLSTDCPQTKLRTKHKKPRPGPHDPERGFIYTAYELVRTGHPSQAGASGGGQTRWRHQGKV